MKDYTYTRKTHNLKEVRYKMVHVSNRLVELNVALRNVGEEMKELSDFLQAYSQEKSGQGWYKAQAEKANAMSRFKANGKAPPAAGAYTAGKHDRQKEIDGEPDALRKLHQTIARWLLSAPHDSPEEIAPLIPAPISMVKRVRVQLVDAGKLEVLHNPQTGENTEDKPAAQN